MKYFLVYVNTGFTPKIFKHAYTTLKQNWKINLSQKLGHVYIIVFQKDTVTLGNDDWSFVLKIILVTCTNNISTYQVVTDIQSALLWA